MTLLKFVCWSNWTNLIVMKALDSFEKKPGGSFVLDSLLRVLVTPLNFHRLFMIATSNYRISVSKVLAHMLANYWVHRKGEKILFISYTCFEFAVISTLITVSSKCLGVWICTKNRMWIRLMGSYIFISCCKVSAPGRLLRWWELYLVINDFVYWSVEGARVRKVGIECSE